VRYEMDHYHEEIIKKLSSLEEILKRKDKKFLTFKEACDYLGFSKSFLYKLTSKNMIPHHKPTGRKIFFFKNDLEKWVTTNSFIERLWDNRN
jgi:excisionase family DNA binding protein